MNQTTTENTQRFDNLIDTSLYSETMVRRRKRRYKIVNSENPDACGEVGGEVTASGRTTAGAYDKEGS